MTLKKKPSIWPLLFTVTGVVVMIGFGTWQLQRLEWKEALLAQIEEGLKADPVALPLLVSDIKKEEYIRYQVVGTFNHDKEVHLFTTSENGQPGYHVYTPLERINASPVIINRGWVPEPLKESNFRFQGQLNGIVTLVGISRLSREKASFVPENNRVTNKWYYADLGQMAEVMDLENAVPVFLEAEAGDLPGGWPKGGVTRVNLPNRHLEYVFTWYSFAAILLGIYLLFRRQQKKEFKS